MAILAKSACVKYHPQKQLKTKGVDNTGAGDYKLNHSPIISALYAPKAGKRGRLIKPGTEDTVISLFWEHSLILQPVAYFFLENYGFAAKFKFGMRAINCYYISQYFQSEKRLHPQAPEIFLGYETILSAG
jgi:hypothetical protein